jgi:hypothetical protein
MDILGWGNLGQGFRVLDIPLQAFVKKSLGLCLAMGECWERLRASL